MGVRIDAPVDVREAPACRIPDDRDRPAPGPAAGRVVGDPALTRQDHRGEDERAEMDAAVQKMVDSFGVPNVFVDNAGWTHRNKPMLDVTEDEFDKVYAINVKAIYHATNIIVPLMREIGGGSIVNIGSVAGIRPRPGLTWYNSTKGAVNILSRSMAVELASDNIRVNAICPVMGETGLLEEFMGVPDTPENRAKFVATIPMGRMSRPDDIARATLYLASDDAEFITGILMPVDGGRTV